MRIPLSAALLVLPGIAPAQSIDAPDAIVCQLLDGNCGVDQPVEAAPPTGRKARTGATRSFNFDQVKDASYARPPSQANVPGGQYDLRVLFRLGSAEIDPTSRAQIAAFAAALADPRLIGRRVRIEGHTDSTGGADSNLGLSDRRARAVSDMIIATGVDSSRLDIRGFGASRPLPGLAPTAAGNRRVIAVLIK